MNKQLSTRLNKLKKLQKQVREEEHNAAKMIMDLLKTTMVNNPNLVAIKWDQYAPHFNDGEPCVFQVYDPYFKLDSSLGLNDDNITMYDEGYFSSYELDKDFFESKKDILNYKQVSSLQGAVKEVQSLHSYLCTMDKELEDMFGNGVTVIVTKDGIETEECDHD